MAVTKPVESHQGENTRYETVVNPLLQQQNLLESAYDYKKIYRPNTHRKATISLL